MKKGWCDRQRKTLMDTEDQMMPRPAWRLQDDNLDW